MSEKSQVYSFGQSEIILGKAIKQFNLPREELVIMTKVCDAMRYPNEARRLTPHRSMPLSQRTPARVSRLTRKRLGSSTSAVSTAR